MAFDVLGTVFSAFDIGNTIGGWIGGGKRSPSASPQAQEGVWCWDSRAAAAWRAQKYRTLPEGSVVWVDPATGGFKVTPPTNVPQLAPGSLITINPVTKARGVFNARQVEAATKGCPTMPDCPPAPSCPPCPAPVAPPASNLPVVQLQGTTATCVPVCPIGTIGPRECGLGVGSDAELVQRLASDAAGDRARRILGGLGPLPPLPEIPIEPGESIPDAFRRREREVNAAVDRWLCDTFGVRCPTTGRPPAPPPDFDTGGTLEDTPPDLEATIPPERSDPPLSQKPSTVERRERRRVASRVQARACPPQPIVVECPGVSAIKSDARIEANPRKRRRSRRTTRTSRPRKARMTKWNAPKDPAPGRAKARAARGRAGRRSAASPSPAQLRQRQIFAERARAGEFRRSSRR